MKTKKDKTERRTRALFIAGILLAAAAGAFRLFLEYDNHEYFAGWLMLRMVESNMNPKDFTHPLLHYYINIIWNYLYYAVERHHIGVRNLSEYWATFYTMPHPPLLLVGRLNSILMAIGTAVLLYATAKKAHGGGAAALAVLLFVSMRSFSNYASYFTYYETNLFFNTLALYCIISFREKGTRALYVAALTCTGLALASDYLSLSLCVPLFFVLAEREYSSSSDTVLNHSLKFARNALLTAVAVIAVFMILNPYILIDRGTFREFFSFHWGMMKGADTGTPPGEGIAGYLQYFFMAATPDFIGPFFFLVLLGGAATSFRRDRDSTSPLLAYVAAFLAVMSLFSNKQERFLFSVSPVLCLLSATYLFRLLESEKAVPAFKKTLNVIATLAVVVQFSFSFVQNRRDISSPNIYKAIREWVEENIPNGSVVALEEYKPELAYSQEYIRDLLSGSAGGNRQESVKILRAAASIDMHTPGYYQVLMSDRPYLKRPELSVDYFKCAHVSWVILNEVTVERYYDKEVQYRELVDWTRSQGPPVARFGKKGRERFSIYKLKPVASKDKATCKALILSAREESRNIKSEKQKSERRNKKATNRLPDIAKPGDKLTGEWVVSGVRKFADSTAYTISRKGTNEKIEIFFSRSSDSRNAFLTKGDWSFSYRFRSKDIGNKETEKIIRSLASRTPTK